jgi:DNA ligase (NAD+)
MDIKASENQYLLAKQKYYEGNPIMSDYEFDLLEENLKDLNSQVINIVGSQSLKDAKFHHLSPMLSLSKIQVHHNIPFPTSKFNSWYLGSKISNTPLEATPKFDGSSCNLIYENGTLEWALTRGDKEKGQNILDKMKLIVPTTINIQDKVEIRGEVVIPIEVFEKKYSAIYKNPRNFVAGILGRDEIDSDIISDFHFVSFESRIHTDSEFYHHPHSFQFLKENGFKVSPKVEIFNYVDFQSIYTVFANYRKIAPYQLDGIVIKFQESERNEIGETSHHPNWAMAIKFPPMESIATIRNILWSPGVSGEFTPIAELDPIDLDGTTVSNVNLHNYGYVIRQGLFPGAKVIVVKSGDIIPVVQKVVESVNDDIEKYIPTTCTKPECNIEVQGDIHLMCTNPNCEHRLINKLSRGMGCFSMRNVASSTIKKLYKAGFTDVIDIFDNSKFNESELIKSGEFKKGRQLEILINSRNNPENKITLPLIITALSFDNLGSSIAKQVAKLIEGETPDWSGLSSACYLPFLNSNGTLNKNSDSYLRVMKFVNMIESNGFKIHKEEKIIISKDSIKYELTGSPKEFGFSKKDEFVKLLKEHNYVHTGLDKSTSILITDDLSSSSSKMAKAKKLGIEIMTYDQVLNLIKNK